MTWAHAETPGSKQTCMEAARTTQLPLSRQSKQRQFVSYPAGIGAALAAANEKTQSVLHTVFPWGCVLVYKMLCVKAKS